MFEASSRESFDGVTDHYRRHQFVRWLLRASWLGGCASSVFLNWDAGQGTV